MKNDIRFLVTNQCNYNCYFWYMKEWMWVLQKKNYP